MGTQSWDIMAGIERIHVDLTSVKESLIPIIWVIGGPGSGRTTQCEYLQARHGWVHLSSGTMMRNEVMSGSKRGQQLFHVMQIGELVPHEIVLDILAQNMVDKVEGATGSQIVPVTRVIYLKLDTKDMYERLMKRDNFDDSPKSVQKRIETFTAKTLPVIEKYCHKIVEVDATKPIHEITEEMLKALTGELEHGGRSVL